ncbi:MULTISPECIES: ATP-binding cassette domain-containing protein [unclassified Staphylococcus]|uniref:ATP-binding cassette domain-containing protein n=1 Tax=unclassified Staphylococcus TaxID=91994 RepID=UPI0021CF87E9|nr:MULTISPECIES: ATP-binding cassette domain-containing protein [unclassified Staphylococcus]UXR77542.1 ATP-binding cassette domain-containing protein [Staphylococcus sp. IVB6227]UXR83316.1 ATP-binding cassette domain-containing protein [Staphylococcus sp. IVB6214]
MIKLSNVIKTYTQGQVQTEVLKGIQLEIAKEDFVAIVGTSGCGKSTLINIIGLFFQEFLMSTFVLMIITLFNRIKNGKF